MTETVPLGISDIDVAPRTHICAFYRGSNEFSTMLVSYFREGLRSGDKCVGLIDSVTTDKVVSLFDPDEQQISGQMGVFSYLDSYLVDGFFKTEKMLDWLTESMSHAADEGYEIVRAIGEMTWSRRALPGVDELCAYESELNRWLPSFPAVLLCTYDLDLFDGRTVVDVLKTHPRVLLGGSLFENPFYTPPDEMLATSN